MKILMVASLLLSVCLASSGIGLASTTRRTPPPPPTHAPVPFPPMDPKQPPIANWIPIAGMVHNGCGFPIYVVQSKCGPDQSTGVYKVNPGEYYWPPYRAYNDRCSQTIKISRNSNMHSVYQIEYSCDPESNVWYNLSSLDGNPFLDVARYLEVRPECPKMYCAPGQDADGCDWPWHPETKCSPAADVKFWLC